MNRLFVAAIVTAAVAGAAHQANGAGPPHTFCANRIHLLRLEDGSARLYCGQRTLTIVEVPG